MWCDAKKYFYEKESFSLDFGQNDNFKFLKPLENNMTKSVNANEVNVLKPTLTVQSDEAKPLDNMRIACSVNTSVNFVDFVLVVCHIMPF